MFGPDPTLAAAVYATLERAINGALAYDPASQKRLAALGDKTLHIRCSAPKLDTFVRLEGGQVLVQQACEAPIDTELSGTLPALAALGLTGGHSLADSGVKVMGSTGLLIELQAIAADLDIDWEEPISRLLGDVAGPSLAGALRSGFGWLKQRGQSFAQRSGEFISEELGSTPSPNELTAFNRDVDLLREDSERLQARLDKLQRDIKQAQASDQDTE